MPISITASPTSDLNTSVASAFYPQTIQRLYVVAARVAREVLAENPADYPDTHGSRISYARQVLGAPTTKVDQSIKWAVVADQVTGTDSTDQALFNRVIALWDDLSSGY